MSLAIPLHPRIMRKPWSLGIEINNYFPADFADYRRIKHSGRDLELRPEFYEYLLI